MNGYGTGGLCYEADQDHMEELTGDDSLDELKSMRVHHLHGPVSEFRVERTSYRQASVGYARIIEVEKGTDSPGGSCWAVVAECANDVSGLRVWRKHS